MEGKEGEEEEEERKTGAEDGIEKGGKGGVRTARGHQERGWGSM